MYRIGVDVGGTFTDFTLLDEAKGELHYHKTPSTPSDPSEAVGAGLADMIKRHEVDPAAVSYLGHGTTVALNMLLERRAPSIGLLTTKGFRDVLEIARQIRPHLYDYTVTRPEPLARRAYRFEVPGRVTVDGRVLTPLDLDAVEEAAENLRDAGVTAIAICFLHAYRFPDHERQAAEIVRRILPDAFISLSSDVLPEFREYERTSTTAVNAYVGPRMRTYIGQLKDRVFDLGIEREPYIIHSNGGLLSVADAATFPVRTCLSGPAAGVVGAAAVAVSAGHPNILAFDVGGTSTDVSLVLGGRPLFTSERTVAGHPVKSPAVDVSAIGAGGGSIAWIDGGGALKVGPHSAGADPGPVAYGRGGENVTLTDANIVLGRLNPNALLGGRMSIDADAAKSAILDKLASPLGLSVEDTAIGIIRVAASGIARAIRSVASAKGHNPTEFALFSYGGAGPLLASDVNYEVGCARILIPREPGTLCARGILLSDQTFDFVRTILGRANEEGWRRVQDAFDALAIKAMEWLANDGVPEAARAYRRYVEARYEGQSFEVRVQLDRSIGETTLEEFATAFHAEHKTQYSYDIQERNIEIVNCRLEAVGKTPKPPMSEGAVPVGAPADVIERRVNFGAAGGWFDTSIHDRTILAPGDRIKGPAILEEMSSTTIIPPGYQAEVDALGNLVMETK
ncbi:MAG: Acetophenone carboxylase gamma subunit [Alphaproteobacteria bacterium MarineAlpha4_Bin2]|nr:MAG: Acetophenone carboxylase gamma subunit [Alphaproteobacteria bacterium MarineAlpha4_Bin2]